MRPPETTAGVAPRVYVVAGMHRAGTSVVARALQALGVNLGSRLMSADVRMNARGFFEDLDLVRIDDALLAVCGADWKNVALLDAIDWTAGAFDPWAGEARALLAARLAADGTYGCKDPRIARLLPFWQRHFADAGVTDHYVIAIRHPLSVIASLTIRDGLDVRRSAWLWLTHLLCAMHYTAGRPRVIVDYDLMMAAPERELERIRVALALPPTPDAATAMATFTGEFLSQALRHSEHGAAELATSDLPSAVVDAWALASVAAGNATITDDCQAHLDALFVQLRHLSPLLSYAGAVERISDELPRLEGELAWARTTAAESSAYADSLRATLTERDRAHEAATAFAVDLQSAVQRKDAELAAIHRALEQIRPRGLGRLLRRAITKNP